MERPAEAGQGHREANSPWHTCAVDDVYAALDSGPTGLSWSESSSRLERYGPNEIRAAGRVSPWRIFLEQFKNVLIVILLVATALSAFLGHGVEAIVIAVIVLFAVVLGFVQEYRAERAIEALRKMAAPDGHGAARRRGDRGARPRPGARRRGPAAAGRPGAGRLPARRVGQPADRGGRAHRRVGAGREARRAAWTVRSSPSGDRKNMVLRRHGRHLRAGPRGGGRHRHADRVRQDRRDAPGRRDRAARRCRRTSTRWATLLARAALVVVALIVALGLLRGQPFMEMLIFGIALAVAVVPEALPAVVTISLAIGVQRMVQAERPDAPAAGGGDAGQHLGDLLGQDRHADQGRDDRAPDLRGRRRSWRCPAPATSRTGEFSPRRRQTRARRPRCGRLLRAATLASDAHTAPARTTAAGTSRATRPRARWWWPPPRPGSTRPSSTRGSRACRRSRSPPRPSA